MIRDKGNMKCFIAKIQARWAMWHHLQFKIIFIFFFLFLVKKKHSFLRLFQQIHLGMQNNRCGPGQSIKDIGSEVCVSVCVCVCVCECVCVGKLPRQMVWGNLNYINLAIYLLTMHKCMYHFQGPNLTVCVHVWTELFTGTSPVAQGRESLGSEPSCD